MPKNLRGADAKADFLRFFNDGKNIEECLRSVDRVRQTYDYWRNTDPKFAAEIEFIKTRRRGAKVDREPGTFGEFCESYLHQRAYWHQLQWVDLIDGVTPRDLHPAQTYAVGRREFVIVNTPPEHPAALDTPVLTRAGWKTMGQVELADEVADRFGCWQPVCDTWLSPEPVPVFRVRFNTGDEIVCSGQHKWLVYPYNRRQAGEERMMTTAQVAADLRVGRTLKWRVRTAPAVEGEDRDLPVDPYLFGYWLGDGGYDRAALSVGDEDTPALLTQLDLIGGLSYQVSRDSRGRSNVVYVHGIRHLLPLGDKAKTIPAGYLAGSPKQRLALLQGLLDSDGTISAKDGRARWVQHGRPGLCRDVYRLIASLGYQPRMKTYGLATEVSFKPDAEPVFRLDRKASRQFVTEKNRRTDFRTIVSVEPAGEQLVKCITAATPYNTYLMGDGLIETGNAKSTTLTMNYCTYRICADPNVRIIIVSKTKEMANRFVYGIKNRLTHPRYRQMQIDFAPENGWLASSDSWKADQVYLGSEQRDSGEKDPTLLSLGIGGQIYGARADLIIVDDAVTLSNAHEFDKQIEWIQQEVLTRLSDTGKLLLIGTRVAPQDLYSELQVPNRYPEQASPWTYLAQPAVLEFTEDPKDWRTLWPATHAGELEVPKWDGKALYRRRGVISPRTWAMAYQQQQVVENAVFSPDAVKGCVNGARQPGTWWKGQGGCRADGMDGLYLVAGLDPAIAGHTAAVLLGVDRASRMRYVVDVANQAGMTPSEMRTLIKDWTTKYGIHEWRIEKNAFQGMLTQDEEIRSFLNNRGCVLKEHHTGCVPTDVEILTRDGWKTHDQLAAGQDTVLTDQGWQVLDGLTVYDAPEKMHRVDSQHLACDFTADHRHLVEWRGNSGTEERMMFTDELKSNTPIRLNIDPVPGGPGIGGTDVAALLGWYLTEGQAKGGALNIAQSPTANPSKWAEIKAHLDALGWSYSVYHQPTADRFHVHATDAKTLHALAPGKEVTVDTVARMTAAERDAFARAMLLGDGCGENFFSTTPAHLDAFEAACLLAGHVTRRSPVNNGAGRFTKNRDCWSVRRKTKRFAHPLHPGHPTMTLVEGEGQVWCPTTEAGTWVARSKGRTFVTGNSNKWDVDFGVASLATLFDGWNGKPPRNLVELPSTARGRAEVVKQLIEQLITWHPETKGKTDLVMALWFAEIRAREIVDSLAGVYHLPNRYLSSRGAERRMVINLDDAFMAQQSGRPA